MVKQDSSVAAAFGAKIAVAAPDTGLYLVTGRSAFTAADVRAAGGQIIMAIPGSFNLIAVMPAASFLYLRQHPNVAHIGPITIDSARFNHFLELLGLKQQSP